MVDQVEAQMATAADTFQAGVCGGVEFIDGVDPEVDRSAAFTLRSPFRSG